MMDYTGTKLGNYRILQQLGHGGFADVYLGEHIYLKTNAAIKILHTQIAQEDIESFRNEALLIAHLMHPNIIRVLDFGVEGMTPFLVMEYAPKGTLRQRFPKGSQQSPAVFMPYLKQVASGLQYAHEQKLIHRDIKPQNMLLGNNDEVKLSDFGIALVEQTTQSQETEDAVTGTIAYMAPEQLQGKARPASDQYSLAVVVYEWLTGNRPFNGSRIEVITQHLTAQPPTLDEQTLHIPHAVSEVLQKALAKEPQQRFASVQSFVQALEQALADQPQRRESAPTYSGYSSQPSDITNTITPQGHRRLQNTASTVFSAQAMNNLMHTNPAKSLATSTRPVVKKAAGCASRLVITVIALPVVLCALAFGGYAYLINRNPPSQAVAMSHDFMGALRAHNYEQAYADVSSSTSNHDNFINQAKREDQCYGEITTYTETNGSTPNNTQVHNYTISRSQLTNPYHLHITLSKDFWGNWHVSDYNSDITSGNPACPGA
ncbi:hypothetical protein KDA_05300 [Dictyobacter alpinus]|uniref:Protein kinase domain-containing protein n=1 Tax=Dictyobacter alpinus TaxID=2014873 RepID=A0A402B122_9CHLR|nr:serine/threonine-protein kinase [Dictyobacter alpinus]GCE25046.1 hypothetical protein KDA_05300 [Dictyobacter alpinus]